MAEVALRQLVHAVRVGGGGRIEHVGHQHRVVDGRHLDAMGREHEPIVFHILGDLQDVRRFEQRFQTLEHLADRELAPEQISLAEQPARL